MNIEQVKFNAAVLSIENRWLYSRGLFNEYLKTISLKHWHIHDGWVMHNGKSGAEVITKDIIQMVWIAEHAGYTNSGTMPLRNEKVLIISDSPDIENTNIVTMHCYNFFDTHYSFIDKMLLRKVGILRCGFNADSHKYESR